MFTTLASASDLPTELLIMIAAEFSTCCALASFAATCRRLHGVLFPLTLLMHKATNHRIIISNYYDHTILHWASRRGYIRVVKGLLEAGAVVDATGYLGRTALMFATESAHKDVVEQLIVHGAAPHFTLNKARTFANAVYSNRSGTLSILFRHGITVDRQGWWMILSAASDGYVDVVRLLLENGVDPNYRQPSRYFGQTAVHLAVSSGHASVVELLAEYGADMNEVNNNGKTAYQCLISKWPHLSPAEDRCLRVLCGRKWWRKMRWKFRRVFV